MPQRPDGSLSDELPTIMQPGHLQWNPNPTLMRPFGGLWGQTQAPPPPIHAQQQTAVVPYILPNTSARRMLPGSGSEQQTPMARPQVPGQFSQHVGPTAPFPSAGGSMSHGKGSRQQTPMARPQVPGQSSQHVGPIVPSEFHQNFQFLDSRRTSGLPLTRWIKSTDWSYKKHIVGCPVHAIPLQAVLYKGFHSYWLRHIAEGRPTYLAGFKTLIIRSSVLSCILCAAERGRLGLGRTRGICATAGRTAPDADGQSHRNS